MRNKLTVKVSKVQMDRYIKGVKKIDIRKILRITRAITRYLHHKLMNGESVEIGGFGTFFSKRTVTKNYTVNKLWFTHGNTLKDYINGVIPEVNTKYTDRCECDFEGVKERLTKL